MAVYLGILLIALATLALEVALTRLLSVTTWYHLAFFAVSTAMLGMTAGAVTVYVKADWFARARLNYSVAKASLGYAVAVPLTLIMLCLIPLDPGQSAMGYYALLLVTLACMLPFYFSGIVLAAIITRAPLPIGKVYAADLIGASLGCLLVLGALELLDVPSLILLCGTIGVFAGNSVAGRAAGSRFRIASGTILGVLVSLLLLTSLTPHGVRPMVVKGRIPDQADYIFDEWNSFSRVVVKEMTVGSPQYWGASPVAPADEKISQYKMKIDGAAGTTLRRFASLEDIDHLRFDVTNVAYYLRPRGGAFIIGVGGGRDIQCALLFGHERAVGIDVNPIFIDLLEGRFRDFAGIADREEVTLIADEARSYLSRTPDTYSIIQMSLIDTWAATGVGAFSLSENSLYSVEAWQGFIQRLSEDGILTVSRWYNPRDLGETGRLASLAVAALLRAGIATPSEHLAMITSGRLSTLLVSRKAFSESDIATLVEKCQELSFRLVLHPGRLPDNEVLAEIVAADSREGLERAIENEPLNYRPPTDENPFFFNMLNISQAIPWFGPEDTSPRGVFAGVVRGNIIATRTLMGLILALLALCVATIVFPLALGPAGGATGGRGRSILWSGAVYFALIGAGFMFAEIALIQRLSVFLGHPIYALGVLLFTVIASAGVGSYLSERLPLTRPPWAIVYPLVISAAILAIRFILPHASSGMMSSAQSAKILVSIIIIAPLGLLLGLGFPTGMRFVRQSRHSETPWYWAINGVFGVLCSALAVFISIYFAISTSLYVAAACYCLLLLCMPGMMRAAREQKSGG